MIKKQCAEPLCSILIPSRQKPPYCEKHLPKVYRRQTDKRDPKLKSFYKSYEWVKFRRFILAQHNNLCFPCKQKGRFVIGNTIHHIKPISTKEGWEERLSSENVFPVCESCHNKIHTEKGGNHE
ncbi:HNH endonuclease [Bacillus cereus group sp. Bc005]|uniref:Putative HNH nuclease YajD n=1 Tax=Bacillus mobilis TaxID=2026190 RepID=A0ABV4S321_9BACI|nr:MULTISPECIES: HNH endonuclease [unclassified Bacillus cereus group]MDA2760924.1 HNH endonuclease [Bacillus cereus group sp. Bc007]MDA2766587.1 HNH endonuclease [Bacillus cereus group sp. Bc008]MDA2777713.1 HNH endonuclease [Bacillus cereus group sp. Bc005]